MSIELMSKVWKRYEGTGSELLLALALADHAKDDGTSIYPSISSLAQKTRQSESTVRRQLSGMRKSGWLISANERTGGRGVTNEYLINSHWVKGVNMTGFDLSVSDTDRTAAAVVGEALQKASGSSENPSTKLTGFQERNPSNLTGFHVEQADQNPVIHDQKGVIQHQNPVTAVTPESSEPSGIITQRRACEPLPDGDSDTSQDLDSATFAEHAPAAYPATANFVNWPAALRQAELLVALGRTTRRQLLEAIRRYADHCLRTDRIATQFVMAPQRFFESDDAKEQPWAHHWAPAVQAPRPAPPASGCDDVVDECRIWWRSSVLAEFASAIGLLVPDYSRQALSEMPQLLQSRVGHYGQPILDHYDAAEKSGRARPELVRDMVTDVASAARSIVSQYREAIAA